MSLHDQLMQETLTSIRSSFQRHMPDGFQRDFYLWGTSDDNPHQNDLLQAMGATQLVALSSNLLSAFNMGREDVALATYCGRMNAYFVYEIMSDDLAMGLSSLATRDQNAMTRQDILVRFNDAMFDRLHGDSTPSARILKPLEPHTRMITQHSRKLSSRAFKTSLDTYLKNHRVEAGTDLQQTIWPILVANMESCSEVINGVMDLQVGDLIREGLINRYRSVTQTLEAAEPLPLDELAEIGAQTILVIPTLAYFSGVLAEALYPQPNFPELVGDGILSELFFQAALQVRLFNDMGLLLTFSEGEIAQVIDRLWARYRRENGTISGIGELLVRATDELPALTRFQKDILHGEFNICLHNLAYTTSLEEALGLLQDNLTYFAAMYRQSRQIYTEYLTILQGHIGTPLLNQLIDGFVQFHVKMYCNGFQQVGGDYVS